jgi:predicted permease
MLQDLRFAFRTILKSPGLVAVAVLSLGLGIGLNTTIFGLFKSVFLTGVTASDPDRVLHVRAGGSNRASYPNYRDLRDSKAVEDLAGYDVTQFRWDHEDRSEKIFGQAVTGNYFELLGVNAALGRTFTPDERAPERNAQVTVITHGFWRNRLGGDRDVLGRKLVLRGQPFTIVGVLPKNHRSVHGFGIEPPIYVPYSGSLRADLDKREARHLELIARIAPGVTPQHAQSALLAAAKELERLHPVVNLHFGNRLEAYPVQGLQKMKRGGFPMPLLLFFSILMVIVTLVLMIACANVAGILLARAANRRREVAVRLAIGATRGRLIRLFLTESLTLAALGAAAATVLHVWAASAITKLNLPVPIPVEFQLQPDWRIVLYAAALTLLTAALCGIAPALEAARADLTTGLKDDTGMGVRRRLFTMRNMLVVGQVSVSLVLLVTSFLFVRSLLHVQSADPGFNVSNQLVAALDLDPTRYDTARSLQIHESAIDSIREIPGVTAASVALIVPLSRNSYISDIEIDGHHNRPLVHMNIIGRGYFETLNIPLLRGREFRAGDREGSPRVAVVNQAFAQRYFAGQDVPGRPIRLLEGRERKAVPTEVVGIVANSKYESLGEDPTPVVYLPYTQGPLPGIGLNLHVQTAGTPGAMVIPIKETLARLDPAAGIEIKTMEELVGASLIPNRLGAYLLGILGAAGLALASIGLYGVIAYAVSRRTREIGVRMALGASPAGVLKTVLSDAAILVGAGMILGLALAAAAAQPLKMFIAGVGVFDPATIGGVVAVLAAVSLVAAIVPARRAMRVDPINALRYE